MTDAPVLPPAVSAVVAAVLFALSGCEPGPSPSETASETDSAATAKTPDDAPTTTATSDATVAEASPSRPQGTPNALAGATSPYLQEHATQPVDWQPWEPEAFELAQRLDRPIFLSIGFSSCYWCFVTDRECFDDEAIAALLNEHFVCIRVDREQRPEVDEIYMTAVRYLRDRGGWPLHVFLEPYTLEPFDGGTFLAPDELQTLVRAQIDAWRSDRPGLLRRADQAAQAVRRGLATPSLPVPLDDQDVENAVAQVLTAYDRTHGGLGDGRTKFPRPPAWRFLLHADWDNAFTREAVLHTLDRMARGGIYDQVGGGFHRYSTDARWLVPHFEKMLDDNAQLASLYADAYERTRDPFLGQIVQQTLDFVLRELTGPDGQLYAALDAEVNGRVGGSYLWTAPQIEAALTSAGHDDLVELALQVYGVRGGPNFRDPRHPEDGRKNVLYLVDGLVRLATGLSTSLEELDRDLRTIDATLLAARAEREQPAVDDKVITSWNGLMIAGLADGGRVLGETKYLDAARAALHFVLTRLRTADGDLLRIHHAGASHLDGVLSDYADLLHGVLALHDATGDAALLAVAEDLAARANRHFADEGTGGWFDTRADRPDLFVRTKSWADGTRPSGNAVMIHGLLDLHEKTGDPAHLQRAARAIGFMSERLKRSAAGSPLAALALHRFVQEHPSFLPGGSSSPVRTGSPVAITTSVPSIQLAGDEPATVEVTLDIADGYRVAAHDPGHPEVIGFVLRAIGDGVDLVADYPAGEPFAGPKGESAIRVYRGRITIPVVVQRNGDSGRPPSVMFLYQLCTETTCLAPSRGLLPVTLELR